MLMLKHYLQLFMLGWHEWQMDNGHSGYQQQQKANIKAILLHFIVAIVVVVAVVLVL